MSSRVFNFFKYSLLHANNLVEGGWPCRARALGRVVAVVHGPQPWIRDAVVGTAVWGRWSSVVSGVALAGREAAVPGERLCRTGGMVVPGESARPCRGRRPWSSRPRAPGAAVDAGMREAAVLVGRPCQGWLLQRRGGCAGQTTSLVKGGLRTGRERSSASWLSFMVPGRGSRAPLWTRPCGGGSGASAVVSHQRPAASGQRSAVYEKNQS